MNTSKYKTPRQWTRYLRTQITKKLKRVQSPTELEIILKTIEDMGYRGDF